MHNLLINVFKPFIRVIRILKDKILQKTFKKSCYIMLKNIFQIKLFKNFEICVHTRIWNIYVYSGA